MIERPHQICAIAVCAIAVCALVWSLPAAAVDSLAVGAGAGQLGWRNIADWGAVNRVTVTDDSVFKWDVAPNVNLATGALRRGGSIIGVYEQVVDDSTLLVAGSVPGLERLLDGDPLTAFSPDEVGVGGMPRDLEIFIDLGASFSVNRIRLYPRLDREHIVYYPTLFSVSSGERVGLEQWGDFVSVGPLTFVPRNPNGEPVLHRTLSSRILQVLLLQMDDVRPWELAEVEIYSDGSVPKGVFESTPLAARFSYPVWGQVRYEGGDVTELSVVLQTRTGPDRYPVQYFRHTGVGDDLEQVSAGLYGTLPPVEQGPVRPNPEWSSWSTVTDGTVRSPGLMRYLQFRITFPQPGAIVRRLVFEYAQPPLCQELTAEVDPRLVEPGEEQTFTLSMVAIMMTARLKDKELSTGFRQLEVVTAAEIAEVEQVLIDDREVTFSVRQRPGEGLTINLGRRITTDGSFIQIRFRGAVFGDATRFEIRAVDRRLEGGRPDYAYQIAAEGDVDPVSAGGALVVRLTKEKKTRAVLIHAMAEPPAFTPNGDGINEVSHISYDLLNLTRKAALTIAIYDLAGNTVRWLHEGAAGQGHHSHAWDGRDGKGRLVPLGVYVFRICVEADGRDGVHQGSVGVTY